MKSKVVLFRPKPDKKDRFVLTVPLSLLTCSAPLVHNNYEVVIIDAIAEGDYTTKILRELEGAICFGVTAMTGYQIQDGLCVSKLVKQKYPDIPIVWGGWHPTIAPKETIENDNIDIVVEGPGDLILLELCDRFKANNDYGDVCGLYFKQDNTIVYSGKNELRNIKEVYDIPYEILDIKKYIRHTALGEKTIDYRTSYGCPYNCTFCADILMSDRNWFAVSSNQVVRELTNLHRKHGVDSVLILENEFFINKKRVREICEGLIANNVKITFGNLNVRPNQLLDYEEELWHLMKQAGMKDLLVGVEAGSQKILDYVNKKTKVYDIVKLKRLVSKYGIELFLSFMIGFPFDDITPEQELADIIKIVSECRKIDEKQTVFISIYMPYPGTKLFDLCIEKGLVMPKDLESWGKIDLTRIHTPWISKKIEKKVNMLNNYIFQYISDQFGKKWDRLYVGKAKFLKKTYHSLLSQMALLRFKHQFFDFAIEYHFLEFTKNLKAKISRAKMK